MLMGADVTHHVAGISVAGVVASTDASYSNYFNELRGQKPFDLNGAKRRRRQSEERVLDLVEMAAAHLRRWRRANGQLPEVIVYYRDGVSDGQFVSVLKFERNLLDYAFKLVGGKGYSPELVIIVGQKRHQTRLFLDGGSLSKQGGKQGKDTGKGAKGKSKGGNGDDGKQVPPGTVAGDGIAQPSHLNFFLVSQQGIQGTSVPCHYHVLHLDERLIKAGCGIDALEEITYQLCHLYSRADKAVSYAPPAYMADHLCERGKVYMTTKFGTDDLPSDDGFSSEEQYEKFIKDMIDSRVAWLNRMAKLSADHSLNGLQVYC